MKEEKKLKRIVLLDSHAILHRAYHALPQFVSSKGEPTGALYGLSTMLIKILNDLKPDYIFACYDLPQPTYRHEAYEAYKAQRKKADPELISQMKRSYDIFKAFSITVYSMPGFEADDILGTIAEELKKDKNTEIIIASGDMDTLQLVEGKKVQVYTLKKGINDTIMYDEKAVEARFGFLPALMPDYKGLRGDPSDNIIGVKGVGEKTATILMQKFGTIENIYKVLKKNSEELKKVGITDRIIKILEENEEEAQFSKMLATIRRDAPIKLEIPEKKWKESVKIDEVEKLFTELDFRTLGARLKEVLKGEKMAQNKGKIEKVEEKPIQNVDSKELKEVSVALWLVDSNLTNPSLEEILKFAKTEDFAKAKKIIFEELKKRNQEKVWEEIEKPIIPIVAEMDARGIEVSKSYLENLSKKYHSELETLQKKIYKEVGEEFNINSPKQLGEILFTKMNLGGPRLKKTAGGKNSTKESELQKLVGTHPIADFLLEYREIQKLLSTYIDNIPEMLDKNSRLHTTLLQNGTTTGRMASENPNVQNIPVRGERGKMIRNAFVAGKGFSLLALDYSQIELRMAAILSGDENLLKIFKGGTDVHTAVAAQVFHVDPKNVDKEMRRKAKVINFGILYGMGVNALRQNLGNGATRKEAQEFYDAYFANFSTLAKYLDEVKAEAGRKGYTETLFGRRRYFAGLQSPLPFIRASAERMAINAPIQGTQADVVKIAMAKVDEFLKKEKLDKKVFLLLQVHDELIYEAEKDIAEEVAPKIRKIMEGALSKEKTKDVPIIANASIGPNWGELKNLTPNT